MAISPADPRSKEAQPPRRTRPVRLWPLIFLPVGGMFVGIGMGREPHIFGPFPMDERMSAALGVLAGSGLMIIIAALILVRRLAWKRYTIGTILIQVAVSAVLFCIVRALMF
jgi:hypothetical protein